MSGVTRNGPGGGGAGKGPPRGNRCEEVHGHRALLELEKAGVVRAERGSGKKPGRLAGSEMWGLKATVRSTLRVIGTQRRVLNKAGHSQLHVWESQRAVGWSRAARIRMEARVAVHVEGRGRIKGAAMEMEKSS